MHIENRKGDSLQPKLTTKESLTYSKSLNYSYYINIISYNLFGSPRVMAIWDVGKNEV